MSKKKIYTTLWSLINIICWTVIIVLARDLIYQIKNKPEKYMLLKKFPSHIINMGIIWSD